ncbi:MAG: hypothetical protein ABEJ93_01080 [Candidatus Nanohalobium sp.]
METKTLAAITGIALILLASGCTLPEEIQDTENKDNKPELASDRGLKIEEFRMTDESLRPNQEVIMRLKLTNYHTEDIDIKEVSIYNEGLLKVDKSSKECNPSIGKLGKASPGNYPSMVCTWRVTAPDKEKYGGFENKPASVNLRLKYESSLTNEKPFKVRFKPLDEINNTESIGKSFSNAEVSMSVSTEDPVPKQGSRVLEVSVKEVGRGRLVEGSEYRFDFRPSHLFQGCNQPGAPVVGNEYSFACTLQGGIEGTRNLGFSTSYKYVKEPVLNVRLVNQQ